MDRFRARGGYTAWPNEMLALGLNALKPDQFRLLGALMLWMEFKAEGSDVRGPTGRPIHVARGQVLVSYQGLAEALGISVDVARRSLRRLAALGALTIRRADATSPATSPTLVDFGKWAGILWAADAPATPPATGSATQAATGSATPPATSGATIQTGTLEPTNQEPPEHGDKTLAPPPAAPARRSRKDATDPRFAPLRATWERLFLADRGEAYRWQGVKDAQAVHALMAVPVAEFEARARRGLGAQGFLRVSTVSQLSSKWNDLTGPAAPSVPSHLRPVGRAEADFTNPDAYRGVSLTEAK